MSIGGADLGVLQSQSLRLGDKSKKIATAIIIMTTTPNKKPNHREMGEILETTSFSGRKEAL